MVAGKSPDDLPPGWKEFVRIRNGKKIKYYSLEEDGKKFHSKVAVMRHVNGKIDGNGTQLKIDGDNTPQLKIESNDTPQPQTGTSCNDTTQPQNEIDCNNTPQPHSEIDCNNDPQPQSEMDCNNAAHQQNKHTEEGSRSVDQGLAKSNEKLAWLPPEWITEVHSTKSGASYKVFIDPGTGRRFYSKLAVMRHLNISTDQKDTSPALSGIDFCNTPQLQSKHEKRDSKSEADTGGAETGKSLSWLPTGWLTEVKSKKQPGQMYRIYIDPATGTKFYSKPQVLKYLGTLSLGDTVKENKNATGVVVKSASEGEVCEQKELVKSLSCASEIETSISNTYSTQIAFPVTNASEAGSVDGLPDGWTKEIRTKDIDGKIKKDVYYKDPGSTFLFCSKKDALRYVETGDYRVCKARPKKIKETNLGSTEANATEGLGKSSLEAMVCEHQESEKSQSCGPEKETSSSNKYSTPIACPVPNAVEAGFVDGLPDGWTKEIRTKDIDGKIKKDVYYKDPGSTFLFSSKKDALRYVETGDHRMCKVRPKKIEETILGSTEANATMGLGKSTSGGEICEHRGLGRSQSCASERETSISNKYSTPVAFPVTNAIEAGSVDGLPDGWTKEIRTKDIDGKMKKEVYYKDPGSTFLFCSKKDALRYVETGDHRMCKVRPKKIEETNLGSTEAHVPLDKIDLESQNITEKIDVSEQYTLGKSQNIMEKIDVSEHYTLEKSQNIMEKIDVSEHYTLGKSQNIMEKIDVSEHYTLGKSQNIMSREEEINKLFEDTVEAVKSDPVESSGVDGLPPGWIKELKPRKVGKRKDTFFVDPISGYMFWSKLDALRYIETGDISKCACKPKKRGTDDYGSTQHVYSQPSPVGQRYSLQSSNGQLLVADDLKDGKNNSDTSNMKVEADSSKRMQENSSFLTGSTNNEAEVTPKKSLRKRERKTRKSPQISEPKLEAAEQKDVRTAASTGTVVLYKQEIPTGMMEQKTSTLSTSGSDTKRLSQSVPGRTSKRIAETQPETPPGLQLSKRSLRSATRKLTEGEANALPTVTVDAVASVPGQPVDPKLGLGSADTLNEAKFAKDLDNQKHGESSREMKQGVQGRASKRLAGCQPEMPNLQLSERSLRAAIKMACEDEATILPMITANAIPSVQPQLQPLPQPFYPNLPVVSANASHEQKLPKDMMEQKIANTPAAGLKTSNKRKAKTTSSKTSKRPAAQSTPKRMSERPVTATSIRSSTRLAGSQLDQSQVATTSSVPAVLPQPLQSEPFSGTAIGKPTQGERHTFPMDRKHVFDGMLEPLNTDPTPGVAEIVSMVVESISKIDEIELNKKPLANDPAVSEVKRGPTNKEASAEIKTVSEETRIQLNEKPEFENSKPQYPQGSYLSVVDSWSDPCLDFAFKTLTGAIPLDHTMSYQGSPQPQLNTYPVNGNGQVGQSGSHKLINSQQNMSSHFQSTPAYNGSFQAQNTPAVVGGNGFFGQSGAHNLVSFQQPTSSSSNSSWQHVQVERPRNPSIPPGFDGVPPYRGTNNNSETRNKDYTRYPGTNR